MIDKYYNQLMNSIWGKVNEKIFVPVSKAIPSSYLYYMMLGMNNKVLRHRRIIVRGIERTLNGKE